MSKEALLIVDMSNDFVDLEGPLNVGEAGLAIVPYIRDLADKFLKDDKYVVISMDDHAPDDKHFDSWPVHNVTGSKGQELYGELKEWYDENKDNDHIIYSMKENYNAFFKTGLEDELRKRDVDTVHIVGVATDICVFLTASGADAYGFKTVIHKQGVATFTDQQESGLEHMQRCFHSEIIE